MNRLRVLDLPADRMEGEALATLFFEDDRPVRGPASLLDWRLSGRLTDLLRSGQVAGRIGEKIVTHTNGKLGPTWILFAGGGTWRDLAPAGYRDVIRHLLETCRQAGFTRVALALAPLDGMGTEETERLVADALAAVQGIECLLSLGPRGRAIELPYAT